MIFNTPGHNAKKILPVILLLFFTGLFSAQAGPAETAPDMSGRSINPPVQVTSRTEPVMDMAVSADGTRIVYITGDQKPNRLWMGSADPSALTLPEAITADTASKSSPAISPSGRYVAYVGYGYDVKGDIYLIDLKKRSQLPARLTGRDTGDGGPCFSPDSRRLYFHQAYTGGENRLFYLDLKKRDLPPQPVDTGGDALFCSVAPNGRRLAFVSFRNDPSGDIFIYDMKQETLRQVTKGPAMDLFPRWSGDGKTLYFSRIGFDTTGDGEINTRDNPIICRVRTGQDDLFCYPVTPLNASAAQPFQGGKKIYFLSNRGGITNCWALPEEGMIRTAENGPSQLKIAESIAGRIPYDPYLSLLAYYRVMEAFPENRLIGSRAGYEIGKIYERLNMPAAARDAFIRVASSFSGVEPESSLAGIREIAIDFKTVYEKTAQTGKRKKQIKNALSELAGIANAKGGIVAAAARLESANILLEAGESLPDLLQSINQLDRVLQDDTADASQKARALFLKAQAYGKSGVLRKNIDTLRRVIHQYPGQRQWVNRAVQQSLDLSLADLSDKALARKIERLHRIAEENAVYAPPLAAGALNRIADLYYASDNPESAKATYREVIKNYPELMTQTAAARLALAEILFREERFRQAIDLYEDQYRLSPPGDRIYSLARAGYIRKTIAAGEFQYRLGEIPAARKTFKGLIDYDAGIVEAHRGYIRCAAVAGDIHAVLEKYQKQMAADPYNPVYVYASALAMTYLETPGALREAEKLLKRAIRLNGNNEYFYQTLGYVNEVLETARGEKNRMGLALSCYQKAYFLNDHANNPQNAANLELNLGNAFYLLKQYNKALSYYLRRRDRGIEFSNPDREILFYKRLGECAFQAGEIRETIRAYTAALDRIGQRMDPAAPSRAFDRLHRFIMDRVVDPGQRIPRLAKQAKRLGEEQSGIGIRVAELTRDASPPPSAKWRTYKKGMQAILESQKANNRRAVKLAQKINAGAVDTRTRIPDPDLQLASLTRKIDEALKAPERLAELKSEMLDRLGLAFQEAGEWEQAADTFSKVFKINETAGRFQNLAVNLRSAAYNRYRFAQTLTGNQKTRQLKDAAEGFKQVIELVDRYGVRKPPEKQRHALIDLTFQASLDAAGATRAAHGFSAIQEKRLAETFLARIYLELGNLKQAEADLAGQLLNYPEDRPVPDKDLYGVALLYHRAGLLANARGDLEKAFTRFARSAGLTLKMKSPASTLMNLTDLVAVAEKQLDDQTGGGLSEAQLARVHALDEQASALIAGNPDIAGSLLVPGYHNTMGVFYARASGVEKAGLEAAIRRMDEMRRAVMHFNRGIKTLESRKTRLDRSALEIRARLCLNMAAAAYRLNNHEKAGEYFSQALETARDGMFPDLKWRALVGLGRTEEALDALETVLITRAGCAPFEIINAFAPMVLRQVRKGKTEAAFNLAERISEVERFNRTAWLIRPHNTREIRFYRAVYPRIKQVEKLEKKLSSAAPDQRPYLKQRISDERSLLKQQFGKNNDRLPDRLRRIKDDKVRQTVLRLMGTALQAQAVADQIAEQNIRRKAERKNPPAGNDSLIDTYNALVEEYRRIAGEAADRRPADRPSDPVTLMAPEPVELMDVQDSLAPDQQLVRIFSSGMKTPRFIVFFVTPDDIKAVIARDKKDLAGKIPPHLIKADPYIAWEAPFDLQLDRPVAWALSGTHLYRCIQNRKPFKNRLLMVPGTGISKKAFHGFQVTRLADILKPGREAGLAAISGTNTLLVLNGAFETSLVPVQPGEREEKYFAVSIDHDTRMPLSALLSATPNLTTALLAGTPPQNAYLLGHLFSIYGCPSIVLFDPGKGIDEAMADFLTPYASMPAMDALKGLSASAGERHRIRQENPRLLGFKGMTPKQAEDLAGKNFIRYIKSGKAAFARGDHVTAVAMFENAVSAANRVPRYGKYLPALYRFGRESAFAAGDLKKAAGFAQKLTGLLKTRKPDSPAYAESLLRLGLIYSKMEEYDRSIPIIESAVNIMSGGKPGPELVRAMMDLGVVLENATDYENALRRFTTAADLSRSLDQQVLLASQYLNIGRVYDLRLSRYAAAMESYKKAYALYSGLNDTDKTAEALLDIGRCYRLLGNFAEAGQYYQKGMDTISEDIENHPLLYAKILIETANNAWFQGRYEEAFKKQRQSYTLAEKNRNPLMQVISLNTAGLIWWTLGNYDKSLFELKKGLETAQGLNVRKDEVASTLNNIGLVFRDRGEYKKALDRFNRALEIDTALKSKWAMAYDYRNKALTYVKMNQPKEAVPLFDKAYAISHAIGNRINAAKALLGKGDAQLALKDYKKAEPTYKNALSLSGAMHLKETQWRSLYGLARINLSYHKNRPAAEKYLKQAMDIIEGLRSEIRINKLKESFIADKLSVYKDLVRLLADRNRPAEAFEIAERSRARNFIDLLGNQKISVGSDADNRLYRRIHAIKSEIEAYESLLGQAADPAEQEVYNKRIADLKNKLENVMLDIQANNPRLASLVAVSPVEVKDLLNRLEPGVALASYYLLDSELFCWVLKGKNSPPEERLALIRIPADKDALKEEILVYRRVLQNLEPWEKQAGQLYDRLVAPILPYLKGIHALGIIPHGPLHYLSFATLYSGNEFLVDRFSLFYLPSTGLLDYTLSRRVHHRKDKLEVLAIGNPDLGDPILNLPFAEQEVNAIAWDFPNITVLTRDRATKDWVVDNISRFDIIHIASHGEFDPVNPLLSAIKLAGSGPGRPDISGDLEAKEIFGLKLKADMVFLSACQTGLGRIKAGDEVIGLNRSFLYAGTHTIVSSLWRVSDVSTAVLIKAFYRRYMTENKADSLRDAQRHVKLRYPHPGYWGAFTLVGDYY